MSLDGAMPEGGALARLRRDGVQLGVGHIEDADGGVVVVVHLNALDDLVLRRIFSWEPAL